MEVKPHMFNGIRHLVGAQGRQRCRVGNFQAGSRAGSRGCSRNPVPDGGVDFGRDEGARYVGAYPRRDLKCAEQR